MKKLLCVLLCFGVIFGLSACKEEEKKEEKVETVVEEKVENKIVYKTYDLTYKPPLKEVKVVDQDDKVWFKTSEIKKICVRYQDGIGRYVEIVLKEKGETALEKIDKDAKLDVFLAGEKIATFKIHTDEEGKRKLIYPGNQEETMGCFNKLT